METHHVRNFAVAKTFYTLACFGIPEFHGSIITAGKESFSIVGEGDILHSLDMTMESAQTVTMRIDIPELFSP